MRKKSFDGIALANFQAGWAHNAVTEMAVHYFKRDTFTQDDQKDTARSLCGLYSPIRELRSPGPLDRCERCIDHINGTTSRRFRHEQARKRKS